MSAYLRGRTRRNAPVRAPIYSPVAIAAVWHPRAVSLPPWLKAWLARCAPGLAVCGGLALLVAIVFGQTVRHDFIDLDDARYVFNNPQVRRGLSAQGVVWAFTERYESNWHPLTWISHMLDWQLYGSWAGGHHLTSAVVHAAAAIFPFWLFGG